MTDGISNAQRASDKCEFEDKDSRLKELLLVFAFFAIQVGAEPVSVSLSAGCEELLGPKLEPRKRFLARILSGKGLARFWTLDELKNAPLSPPVAAFLMNQTNKGNFHQGMVGLLPDGVDHHFKTLASTYLDMPSAPLKATTKDELFFQWVSPGAAPAVHSLVLSSYTTDSSLLHEALHLRDLNEVQRLVQMQLVENQGLLISIALFRVVDELIVYKDAFLASERSQSFKEFSTRSLFHDIDPAFQNLSAACQDSVLNVFQLGGWERASIAKYLESREKTPAIGEVITRLVADGCATALKI